MNLSDIKPEGPVIYEYTPSKATLPSWAFKVLWMVTSLVSGGVAAWIIQRW